MYNSEDTVIFQALSGKIEASPLVIKNGENPTKIYESVRSTLQKYPEYFMFSAFSGDLKHPPIKVKPGDELKVHCCVFGDTREEQELINETYRAIFDDDIDLDVSFASLLALKIVFGIKRGVAFFELADRDDIALVILDEIINETIVVASVNDDGKTITVTQAFDLFTCYKENFTICSNELEKDNVVFSEDKEDDGFIEWVHYIAKLATQYHELLNSGSERLKTLRQKIETMPKEDYDALLMKIRLAAFSKHFIDPIELIESA